MLHQGSSTAQLHQRKMALPIALVLAEEGNPWSKRGAILKLDGGEFLLMRRVLASKSTVRAAMSRLGAPYVWGAAGPTTFDCSGLVVWSFAQVGISLPHYSYSQMAMGSPVSYSDLQPGDLVFFYGGSHVGIYIGGGQFIHAPHTGTVVQVTSLSSYSLTAARRIG